MRQRRDLTSLEVRDRVLVALSHLDGTVALDAIRKGADVKVKEAVEALKQHHADGRVDHWPAIKGYRITDKGREMVAAIETRQTTAFQWTWKKGGQ